MEGGMEGDDIKLPNYMGKDEMGLGQGQPAAACVQGWTEGLKVGTPEVLASHGLL